MRGGMRHIKHAEHALTHARAGTRTQTPHSTQPAGVYVVSYLSNAYLCSNPCLCIHTIAYYVLFACV